MVLSEKNLKNPGNETVSIPADALAGVNAETNRNWRSSMEEPKSNETIVTIPEEMPPIDVNMNVLSKYCVGDASKSNAAAIQAGK